MAWGKATLAAKSMLIMGAAVALSAAAPPQSALIGIWKNPHDTVRVKTGNCDGGICGWVVWASDKAIQDARDSGTENLVGTEILRQYRQTASNSWQGEVYVPDMGGTFYSRIRQVDDRQIKVSGCLLHGLICKSQVWQRA